MAKKGGRGGAVSRKTKGRQEVQSHGSLPTKADTSMRKALLGDFAFEDAHLYRALRSTFTIYLGNEATVIVSGEAESFEPGVEHNMADRFELNLHILSNIDPNRPILVYMASDGGYWEPGMQMFSAILACPNPITVLAVRDARSMTSIIPLAADKFLLRPPAQYMFHHGTWGFSGLVQEGITDFFELLKTREIMLRVYMSRLNERGRFKELEEKRVREILERAIEKRVDVWLDPAEARRWGFVDGICNGNLNAVRATKINEKRRNAMRRILQKKFKYEDLLKEEVERLGI